MHIHTYAYVSNFRQLFSDGDFLLRSLFICFIGVVFSLVAATVSFRLGFFKRKKNQTVTGRCAVGQPETAGSDNATVTGRSAVVQPETAGSDNAVIRSFYVSHASSSSQAKPSSNSDLVLTLDSIQNPLASLSQVSHASSSSQAKPSSDGELVLTLDSIQNPLASLSEVSHASSSRQAKPSSDGELVLTLDSIQNPLASLSQVTHASSSSQAKPSSDSELVLTLDGIQNPLVSLSQVSHASSSCQAKPSLDSELVLTLDSIQKPLTAYCKICLDNKESWQMFINDICNHSFCYECTSKHAVSRVQDNMKTIDCPGADCRATLDFNKCRLIIPEDMFARWDEHLCQSIIPDSQKLFCPFRNCSAMLINDSKEKITCISCPECHRSFCVFCRVPWHSDFTCEEFQKLNSQNGAKELVLTLDSIQKPLTAYCEICMENKESWHMFINDSCNHSFCCHCTGTHAVSRVQDNFKTINCPGADCRATLDIITCRLFIPKDMLAKWDELLCRSIIPDSEKLFCPFRDCSALLINDSKEKIMQISCPECHRSFCVMCLVPWHSDFTCEEFQKLNSQKGAKDELMLKFLAKKKHWQKCPSCKIHVEKSEGCIHMTCRCGYEFCYICGSKWTASHVIVCRKYAIV